MQIINSELFVIGYSLIVYKKQFISTEPNLYKFRNINEFLKPRPVRQGYSPCQP